MDTYQFSFEKLEVWQLARILTTDIYKHTVKFPNEEKYLLTSQLRRAAVSIASNLAEGSGFLFWSLFMPTLSQQLIPLS